MNEKTYTIELTEQELVKLIQATINYKDDAETKAINLKLLQAHLS